MTQRLPDAGRRDRSEGDLPVVFVHVMKTAGTTFLKQLAEGLGPDALWPPQVRHLADGRPQGAPGSYGRPNALLSADPDELRAARVVAGHHPVAIADDLDERLGGHCPVVTILREPLARVESHVRQIRRLHFEPDAALDEVYEHASFHDPWFCDHQTKVLSATIDEVKGAGARRRRRPSADVDPEVAGAVQALVRDRPAGKGLVETFTEHMPEDEAARFMLSLLTPPAWWISVDDRRLAAAVDRLERLEVVGLTEHYDDFTDAVERRFGWRLPAIPPQRRAPDRSTLPASLLRRMTEENAHDLELYERARALLRGA